MRVLVTGSTGFVGGILCSGLAGAGHEVRAATRGPPRAPGAGIEPIVIGDINATTDWDRALQGIDAVIHLAARAHVLHDPAANAERYFEVNARGTGRLAEACAAVGVHRFVYVSSIKVNGEQTGRGTFTTADLPDPRDAYGRSKLAAERRVMEIADGTGMEAVIVRPPIVYGPGVRANFLRLMRWVDGGWPLPFGKISNQRSLVSIWNLCDLLALLLQATEAPGRVWFVSDGEDLSTPGLIRRLARAMNCPARLLSVPPLALEWLGRLAGKRDEVARLCGSLAVDIGATRRDLGWNPPLSVDESLARTVEWFRGEGRARGG